LIVSDPSHLDSILSLSLFLAPPRMFFPVFEPKLWGPIDARLNSGAVERVTVLGSSCPEVREAVLLKQDFVTMSYLEHRLRVQREEIRETCLNHCRGMRKMAKTENQPFVECSLCSKTRQCYICEACAQVVCISCFPMALFDRVTNADPIVYQCPFCRQDFASFPRVSITG
jgi:hypothetical protein